MIFDMEVKESKKICKRNSSSKLEGDDDLEGFQIVVRLYSACDVQTSHVLITL